jgi:hypothetical protein
MGTNMFDSSSFDRLADNRVWREFRRQEAISRDRLDLVPMWVASGRKHFSPRRFASSRYARPGCVRLEVTGKRPDDPVWADLHTAFSYVQLLDVDISMAATDAILAAMRADPVGLVSRCEPGCEFLMGMYFDCASREPGLDRPKDGAEYVREAVERTEGWDEYRRETGVSMVQRVLGHVHPADAP